jgi:hypothetical protein
VPHELACAGSQHEPLASWILVGSEQLLATHFPALASSPAGQAVTHVPADSISPAGQPAVPDAGHSPLVGAAWPFNGPLSQRQAGVDVPGALAAVVPAGQVHVRYG